MLSSNAGLAYLRPGSVVRLLLVALHQAASKSSVITLTTTEDAYLRPRLIATWSLLTAALLIGCDLSQLDEFTLALLTNPEVLDVNQDPLGEQARRVTTYGRQEVWARRLADGTIAAGLFNHSRREATVTVNWSDLELWGPQPVRNLWSRTDEGILDGGYSTVLSGHGAVMLEVGTPQGHGN
jgi:hypothetical protein